MWLAARLRAGFRARGGSAVLLAVLAAIVAAAAATTPILITAVQQAALMHALAGTPVVQRSVLGNASSDDTVTPAESRGHAAAVTEALGRSAVWTPTQVYREQNDAPLQWKRPTLSGGQPKQRIGDVPSCAVLRFVAGRCPTDAGEAVIATTTARRQGVRLGEQVVLASTLHRVTVTIVGVYDPDTAVGRLAAHPSVLVDSPTDGLDPDLLLSPTGYDLLKLPTTSYSIRTLRTSAPLAALPAVRAGIARATALTQTAEAATASTHVLTRLGDVLDRVDQQRIVVAVVLDVVAVSGFGLSLAAFAAIAQRIGRVRAAEWALPRLRGMPRRRRLAARLVEPLLAMTVGTAAGLGIAVAVAVHVVDPTTRMSLDSAIPAAVLLALAAFGGGAAGLVAVAVAADRRPLDEQLHRSVEPRELSRLGLVTEAVVVVAAIASVVALLTDAGSDIDGAGLLAPVLIALAVGFLGLQLALVLVRRRTRTVPTTLAGLVVWRRLSRAPSTLVGVVLVAAAVALGTFVSMTSATADALAGATAEAQVAAPTVLHVRTPAGVQLVDAVDRADPSGRVAMAAEQSPFGTGVTRVIAVDTARIAAVSTWRAAWAGLDAGGLRRALAPAVESPVQLTGKRMTIAAADIDSDSAFFDVPHFQLQAVLQGPHGLDVVAFSEFDLSRSSREFTASIPCSSGCTLVSLSLRCTDQYPSPWEVRMTLTALSTDTESADRLRSSLTGGKRWIDELGHVLDPTLPSTGAARPGADGLALDFADTIGTGSPAVRVRDTVEPLPAVFADGTTGDRYPGAAGTTVGTGVDGSPLLIRPVARASALPRLLGDGVLVDLRLLSRQSDEASTRPDEQVWIAGDPSGVVRSLRHQGVSILGTERLAAAVTSERGEAGPLSARFAFVGAIGAFAVVLIALIGTRLLGAPERRRRWESFAAAGLRTSRMRRLIALEFLAPVAAAAVLGVLSGVVAFLLALPHLPLADAPPLAPPSGVVPPWIAAAVFPVAALLAAGAATVLVARAETAGLGEGEAS